MRPLIVQQSFPDPRPTTNPYIWLLRDALQSLPDTEVHTFTWARALFGRYDVFHVHWPEILVDGRSRVRAAVRQSLTAVLLVRLRATRTPLVRTVHNVELPEGLSWSRRRLLRAVDRQTTMRIRLNTTTELPVNQPYATILHGHFRDWFEQYPRAQQVHGRIAYFGLIRRYKNVDTLLRVFALLPGDGSLHVEGLPSSAELRAALEELASHDDRVRLRLEFLTDEDLVRTVSESELVVLPYREMHNSGSVLTALSLDKPVLVPANLVTERLRDEVGRGWVFTYPDALTADVLAGTLAELRGIGVRVGPDLSARNWDEAGRAHVRAYRSAITLARRGRVRSSAPLEPGAEGASL